ncbi:MAG: hypothetical protein LBV41_10910, partial [Cytophagaceae bacterium]|nr:hypothetical protein [Cytophagaceae bacterium]
LHLLADDAVALVEHAQDGFVLQLRPRILDATRNVGAAQGGFPRGVDTSAMLKHKTIIIITKEKNNP